MLLAAIPAVVDCLRRRLAAIRLVKVDWCGGELIAVIDSDHMETNLDCKYSQLSRKRTPSGNEKSVR